MNLRDLVGKMAIRTAKSDVAFPWELHESLFAHVKPYGISCHSDKEKYMNHPVKIIAVKEEQVVIEEHGERKLLERRFIDNHWVDYDKFLHPEEEEKEKAEKLMKEFEVAAEPIKHFLAEHYDPMCTAVIHMDNIQIFRGELGESIQNICCRCGAEVEEEMKG
jgi:hypothetical protein